MTDRCEPPPELRGVDGWHWVMVGDGPEEIAQWFAGIGGTICGWWMGGNSAPQSQEWIEDDHGEPMRYLYPVATPAEVEALQYEIHDLRHDLNDAKDVERENATLRARVAELERALQDIIADAAVPQELYDKIGPTWTGKDGHEYADMSYVLDKCAELSEVARAALSPATEAAPE